eukprot:gene61185-81563_t
MVAFSTTHRIPKGGQWLRPFAAGLLGLALALGLSAAAGAAERALDKQVVVPATLDQTWAVWTTREGIVSFMAPGAEIDARV